MVFRTDLEEAAKAYVDEHFGDSKDDLFDAFMAGGEWLAEENGTIIEDEDPS